MARRDSNEIYFGSGNSANFFDSGASESVVDVVPHRFTGARVLSVLALLVSLAIVGQLARSVYRASTDSLVAPIVLSPDSEMVLPNRLNLARLMTERDTLVEQVQQNQGSLDADARAIQQLQTLRKSLTNSLNWVGTITARSHSGSVEDLRTLDEQQHLLTRQIVDQDAYVRELGGHLQAGLVHRSDLLRERGELTRLRLAALQLKRERRTSESQLQTSRMALSAIRSRNADAKLVTPEMIQQREHLVQVDLDLLKLETEMRSKQERVQNAGVQIQKVDALLVHMKGRPMFRAVDAEQYVAFVPYTQIARVKPGAEVLNCRIWGLFFCDEVGTVSEVLGGEIVAQDPWGSPARGQYALLKLEDADAAHMPVLHVR